MTAKSSYAHILKASSIMGGAAGIGLLLGMVRVKFAAIFIGTTGVGLIASFGALQSLVGTLAGLGLQSSAVRDIAAAAGRCDEQAIGRAVLTLRRLCWLTGLVGMAAMVLLSPLLSQLTFGNRNYTADIAALGLIILFGNLSGGQMALIQGMRRIGDMARANIIGGGLGTVAAIGFYATLGLRGIVPTLVTVSAVQLVLSWYFARRVPVPEVELTWHQTFTEGNGMVKLGLVMMWNGLLGSAVAFGTVALITQYEGVQAVGLYSAAFALSGVFVGFVLGAMGADYYPRLTGVVSDKTAMRRMVNEQTEIGLLLALPGLLATMALAPWIVQIFYAREFLGASELLQWFILGCLGRVISWPLGYIILALGKSNWLIASETFMHSIHILLIFVGLQAFGLIGVAQAFVALYAVHMILTLFIANKLIGFAWTKSASLLIFFSYSSCALLLVVCIRLDQATATVLGLTAAFTSSIFSTVFIAKRTKAGSSALLLKKLDKLLRFA